MNDGYRSNNATVTSDVDRDIQPRIIKDKVSNQIKLEDTLMDYMEIIISLNQKLNKHVQTTKIDIQSLESRLGKATIGSYMNDPSADNPIPKMAGAGGTGGDGGNYTSNVRMVHLETEIEKLRLDVKAQ